mgnify:CR=1 FL=1
MEKIKVLVATPMYGGFCTGFYLQCMMQTQMVFNANKVEDRPQTIGDFARLIMSSKASTK